MHYNVVGVAVIIVGSGRYTFESFREKKMRFIKEKIAWNIVGRGGFRISYTCTITRRSRGRTELFTRIKRISRWQFGETLRERIYV